MCVSVFAIRFTNVFIFMIPLYLRWLGDALDGLLMGQLIARS